MTDPISPGNLSQIQNGLVQRLQGTEGQESGFKNLLLEGLNQVQSMQVQADTAVQDLMTGKDINSAEVLTAVQKADMAFELMMQMRNKLVQAFQEIKELRI